MKSIIILHKSFILLLLLIKSYSTNGFVSPLFFHKTLSSSLKMTTTNNESKSTIIKVGTTTSSSTSSSTSSRRHLIQQAAILFPLSQGLLLSSITTQNANAVDITLLDQQASKFKRVPLFAIVDGTTGTPFMILQNTGKAQAYFFTSYDGAQAVLDDARRDAADKGFETKSMWDGARISAVNLEFALKIGSGKPKAMAQNKVKYESVSDIIPSITALNDAEKIDKSGMYKERGRVPLFYSDEFEIGPEKEGGPNRIPVFLERSDLLREYAKKYPDKEDVFVTVVDLMDTFSTMMGNKPIGAKVDERIVQNFFIVPSMESRKKAVECEKERGSIPAYNIGEMVAVGGK